MLLLVLYKIYSFWQTLTLFTWAFLSLKNNEWGGTGRGFPPPFPAFFLEQQWCWNLVSSFTNHSGIHEIIQNYESTQASWLRRHCLPCMAKIFFCLFMRHKTSWKWHHKHVIIGLTNKSFINKRLLIWDM